MSANIPWWNQGKLHSSAFKTDLLFEVNLSCGSQVRPWWDALWHDHILLLIQYDLLPRWYGILHLHFLPARNEIRGGLPFFGSVGTDQLFSPWHWPSWCPGSLNWRGNYLFPSTIKTELLPRFCQRYGKYVCQSSLTGSHSFPRG